MSINYVILGYLSWRPMTGYDIKKIIADAETLPWSANNNQIYRALIKLHQDGWVTKTIENQVGAPDRHVYAVTPAGLEALKDWVVTTPDPPQSKKPFLDQLMWADCLDAAEMDQLLEAYIEAVGEKLFFLRVQADEKPNMPERTPRETYLWEMIHKNWIAHFELELKWVRQMREELMTMEKQQQRELARQARA
ncbi:MAG: PadR family transcriptional regulator [Ardenticatenaceae bacterium]|nr:PadR family transcriptional regulator [Ardenticatenaceae bacterium]